VRPALRVLGVAAVLSALALLGLVVGCGGGSASSDPQVNDPAPRLLPKEQFVQRVDVICRKSAKKMSDRSDAFLKRRARETGEPYGRVGTAEMIPATLVPTLRTELKELEAVGLPKGQALAAELLWLKMKMMLHRVEVQGVIAWWTPGLGTPIFKAEKQLGINPCFAT
jgi:hypothetical protein